MNLLPPEGPRADIIRKLRHSKHHRVAVPWMVLEEMAAHQAKLYPVRYQGVVSALDKLRDVLPWDLKSTLEPLDLDRLVDHWRALYRDIFEVIETSGEVARRALTREALALPPAKRAGDHSEGARDVAIWFSILEYLKANPGEEVCLVTNNTKDFGDGVTYPYPMNEDVEGLQHRITRLTDFDEVVSKYTTTVSGKDAEDAAHDLLKSLPVLSRVSQTALELLASTSGFMGLGATGDAVQWRGWLASPEVELLAVTDVTGHEIEGDVWYTANARWILYGPAFDGHDTKPSYTACAWETKVLFSTQDKSETPTLLAPQEPEAPDASDPAISEILSRLKKQVARMARQATTGWRQGSPAFGAHPRVALPDLTPGLTAISNRLANMQPKININSLAPGLTSISSALADMQPKMNITGLGPILTSISDTLPKLDVAANLPQLDLISATGAIPNDEGEEEGETDSQLSFDDADDEEPGDEDGSTEARDRD
ncbi:hypothetical protein NDF60_28570 [Streptomyces sp. STCH 565 A]|nr:hypothetical protein [Streptomyces sp. STCH 565 A]